MKYTQRESVRLVLADKIGDDIRNHMPMSYLAYDGIKGTGDMSDEELAVKLSEYDITVEDCVEIMKAKATEKQVVIDINALPKALRDLVE